MLYLKNDNWNVAGVHQYSHDYSDDDDDDEKEGPNERTSKQLLNEFILSIKIQNNGS